MADIPTWADVPTQGVSSPPKRKKVKSPYDTEQSILDALFGLLEGDPERGMSDENRAAVQKTREQGINIGGGPDSEWARNPQDRPTLAPPGGDTLGQAVLPTRPANEFQGMLDQFLADEQGQKGAVPSDEFIAGILGGPEKQMFPQLPKTEEELPMLEQDPLALPRVDDLSTQASPEDKERYANSQMGILDRYNKWINEDNRAEKLLRLGHGMLSTNEWYEGMAEGAKGIADVDASQRKLNAAGQAGGSRRFRNMILRNKDGSITNVVHDRSLGSGPGAYTTTDGQPVDTSQGILSDLSDIDAGLPTTTDMTKRQRKIVEKANALRQTDDIIDGYLDNQYEGGVAGAVNTFSGMMNTLMGKHLDPKEFWAMSQAGREEALIGAMREATVGPGVMTEYDAVRIMRALGQHSSGNSAIKRAMTNPEVAAQLLEEARERVQAEYDAEVGTYNYSANHPYYKQFYPQHEIYSRDNRISEREARDAKLKARRELIKNGDRGSVPTLSDSAESAKSVTEDMIGETIEMNGKRYRIVSIVNGRPQLKQVK